MIDGLKLSPSDVQAVLASPNTIKSIGRLVGIGEAESQALMQGKFPVWFWVTVGVLGGTYLGVTLYRKHPGKVDRALSWGK